MGSPSRDRGGSSTGRASPGSDVRPTEAQRRYLMRGLAQAGGKLPLFDTDGREIPKKTIESCIALGRTLDSKSD
jgi:hypothetical protein